MKLSTLYLCNFPDKVICYYASWAISRPGNGQFTPEDIQANLCTHVNYAFIGLNSDGTLQILDEATDVQAGSLWRWRLSNTLSHNNNPYLEGFKRVSALKDINPNLKVLFSVGGASADPSVFGMVASDAQKLATLSESALELIRTYNFDGLDVDWEYPRGGDQVFYINNKYNLYTYIYLYFNAGEIYCSSNRTERGFRAIRLSGDGGRQFDSGRGRRL